MAAWQAGPPAGHPLPIVLKLLAEAPGQSRVLDPVNEKEGNGQERSRVDQQHRPAEQQRLPGDGQYRRHIEGVADVPVRAADGQPLGIRLARDRYADTLGGELRKGPRHHDAPTAIRTTPMTRTTTGHWGVPGCQRVKA